MDARDIIRYRLAHFFATLCYAGSAKRQKFMILRWARCLCATLYRERTNKQTLAHQKTIHFQASLSAHHLPSLLLRRVRISVIRRLRLLGLRSRVRVRVFGLARKQSRQLRRDHIVLSLGLSRSRWRWWWRRSLARSRRLAAGNCRSLRGRLLADYDCREGRRRLR